MATLQGATLLLGTSRQAQAVAARLGGRVAPLATLQGGSVAPSSFLGSRLRPGGAHCPQRHPRLAIRAGLDPGHVETVVRGGLSSAHQLLYTLGDAASDAAIQAAASAAASSASDVATQAAEAVSGPANAASTFVKQSDWLSGLADGLEGILKLLERGISAVHIPYAYGFSIILLTFLVKAATYPLTKKQVESTMSMQNLQPKLKAIQSRYQGDQERIQLETARLYKQAGVNPLAGCLPTLATIPVWIGLYRALSNVAAEGILTEGFFWIPSLAGPTSVANRQSGSGLSWLFPFVDGAPPLGWGATVAYLVLPVLLVASQYASMQLMTPPTTDPAQKNTQAILKFLPLMIGYFSLSVPSGLSLYWLTNNALSTAQQLYLKQGGGANPAGTDVEIIDAGQARRSATPTIATEDEKERLRGERFKQIKAAEADKKAAARRAAEEASRAAAARTEQDRQRLSEQQHAAGSHEGEEEEDDEGEDGEAGEVPDVAPAKVGGGGNGSASKPAGKRSKRTKRVKTV